MRSRSLVVSIALVALLSAPARAQTCLGLASYSGGPMQVSGKGSLTIESTSVEAGLGYGLPASVFGSVAFGTTSNDNFGGSRREVGATLGYQIALGRTGAIQLCPVASFGLGLGPKSTFSSGVNRSQKTASLGVVLATSFVTSPRVKIVPSVGLSYAYQQDKAENNAGASLFRIAEHFALAQVGVGLVLDSNITVRPGVEIPFSLNVNDPSFALTVSYSFGRKRKV
jgi:hypothetical protein